MLAMKIELLLKKFEYYSQDMAQMQTLQALETRMTCEVCGNVGHSGDNCQEIQEKVLFLNATMGFIHKEVRGGINHAHTTKEVMEIQIFSILTSLPSEILSTAKRRSMSPFRRSWPLQTNLWRPSMPRWTDSPLL